MKPPLKTSGRPNKKSSPPTDDRPTTSRRLALDVLGRVFGDQRPFDEAFAGHSKLESLETRDRAFARLLVTTVLRRRGQIDEAIDRYVKKAPDPKVRNILRLGAAQLMFLETPAHAAVGETVELAEGRASYAQGMVNAVLRRLANELNGITKRQDPEQLNLPDWLWQSWTAAYGEEMTRAIVEAQLNEPPLDISVRDRSDQWAKKLEGNVVGGQTVRRTISTGGPIDMLPGYDEGAWWIQDVAATLPARLMGPLAGRHVIDLCAAPGGKTAQLAAAGAKVTAIDVSEQRAERLRENLARLKLDADVTVADALEWRAPEPAVLALLDAPCTATGTIRRHPDIAWQKTPKDVERMAALQAKLIRTTIDMLVPGGILIYAVCSLQPEEGESLIERVLDDGLPLARVPISSEELFGLPVNITDNGEVRTLPSHLADQGGMDGFFIARLQRVI
ncbi:MAG: RsmB/NOP family class I SAM-dependent RNA methyltransferase [Geminicoccaceae bacterium]